LDKLLLLQAIHLAKHATDLFNAAVEAPETIDTLLLIVEAGAKQAAEKLYFLLTKPGAPKVWLGGNRVFPQPV